MSSVNTGKEMEFANISYVMKVLIGCDRHKHMNQLQRLSVVINQPSQKLPFFEYFMFILDCHDGDNLTY